MTAGDERMTVKRGGGWLMLFGLPFFIAGVATIVSGITGGASMEDGSSAPPYFIIPFGLIFAAVGAVFVFGRLGVTFDLYSRKVTTWWGLLVPFKSTDYPLEKIEAVTISREIRRSKNSSHTVYPVRLGGLPGQVTLEEPRSYASARRRAEEVAKFIDVGLRDTTSGRAVVREAGTLDESLRERAERTGERPPPPEAPAGARTRVETAGDEATMEIPPPGLGITDYIMLAFGSVLLIGLVVAAIYFAPELARREWHDPIERHFFLVFFSVAGLVALGAGSALVFGALRSGLAHEVVTVSPRALRLERRSALGSKTAEIPADELEELQVGRPEGDRSPWSKSVVVARSDKRTLEIGRGLAQGELAWLKELIEFVATSSP